MRVETAIDHEIGGRKRSRPAEWLIAELAAPQHGVVARRQLLTSGLSSRQIDRRVELRRLHRVHSGVYAVGHSRLSQHGAWMAGVLASGPGAVLSHRSAAVLWGIRASWHGACEVGAPRALRPRARLLRHHVVLMEDERTIEQGISVTTVARTLLDLAAVLTPKRSSER